MTEQHLLIPLGPGERLRQERERNGLTLADVARSIHISEQILQAIESQQVESIPYVYLRGYVQNYARFLRIPDEESRQFMTGFEDVGPQVQSIFPGLKRNPADRYLKAFSYVLASLLIGTLAWQVTHEAVRLSQGRPMASSPENSSGQSQLVPTEKDGDAYVNASIASLEKFQDRYTRGDQGTTTPGEVVDTDKDLPEVPEGMSRLTLSASADSWVEITDVNGQRLEMDLVRGGSLQHYVGQPPFTLMLGRSSAMEISLDGKAVNIEPSADGDAVRTIIGAPETVAGEDGPEPDRG